MRNLVKQDKTTVTIEDMKKRFPQRAKTITQDMVDIINGANNDPNFNGDELLNSMYSYEHIMYRNKASLKEYVNAIKFCGYLLTEEDNYIEAYKKARAEDTFVQERKNDPVDSPGYKALSSAAARYRKNPLVVDILTQAQVPWDLMYAHAAHKAIGVLSNEMMTATYSRDRINAADKLLANVKPQALQMKIEAEAGEGMVNLATQMSNQIAEAVKMQRAMLESGVDFKEATKIHINVNEDVVDAEVEDN